MVRGYNFYRDMQFYVCALLSNFTGLSHVSIAALAAITTLFLPLPAIAAPTHKATAHYNAERPRATKYSVKQAERERDKEQQVKFDPAAAVELKFVLVDADTGEDISILRNGDVLDLSSLPTRHLNMRAEAPANVKKIVFQLNGVARYRYETSRPFSLAGDRNGKYNSWTPPSGLLTVSALPYTAAGKGEEILLHLEVRSAERKTERKIEQRGSLSFSPGPAPRNHAEDESERRRAIVESDIALPQSTGETAAEQPAPSAAAVPSAQPTAGESDIGRCLGMLSNQTGQLTVVCSHQVQDPVQATVIETESPVPDENDGKSTVLCEFLNATSPIVTTCATSAPIISAFHRGQMYVALQKQDGRKVYFSVREK
jgi:hypothetical protein